MIGLTPPSWLIRDALRTVDGIDAAFASGSTARGTANADSHVDVFVFGNEVYSSTRRFLREVLAGRKTWAGGSVSALEPLAIASDAAFSPPVEYAP